MVAGKSTSAVRRGCVCQLLRTGDEGSTVNTPGFVNLLFAGPCPTHRRDARLASFTQCCLYDFLSKEANNEDSRVQAMPCRN